MELFFSLATGDIRLIYICFVYIAVGYCVVCVMYAAKYRRLAGLISARDGPDSDPYSY